MDINGNNAFYDRQRNPEKYKKNDLKELVKGIVTPDFIDRVYSENESKIPSTFSMKIQQEMKTEMGDKKFLGEMTSSFLKSNFTTDEIASFLTLISQPRMQKFLNCMSSLDTHIGTKMTDWVDGRIAKELHL